MTTAQANFWIVFMTAAATLAGFTLASYSIFITRIEIAAADEICRRYLFKECTSQYSLSFILFALTMFVVPLGLGLSTLFPNQSIEPFWRIPIRIMAGLVLFVFIFVVAMINGKQISYGVTFLRYRSKLKEQSPARAQRRSYDLLHLIMAFAMLVLSWMVLALNLLHLVLILERAGAWEVNRLFWGRLASMVPAELSATASLFVGLALVGWHFYLFEPTRLVFRVDEDTRSMISAAEREIEKSWELLDPLRNWLRTRIANAEKALEKNGASTGAEARGAKILLERAKVYLEGKSPGLKGEEGDTLESRKGHHLKWIEFCASREVMTFGDIVWIMNGIDLYLKALINFEQRLKEMPAQLEALIAPLPEEG